MQTALDILKINLKQPQRQVDETVLAAARGAEGRGHIGFPLRSTAGAGRGGAGTPRVLTWGLRTFPS